MHSHYSNDEESEEEIKNETPGYQGRPKIRTVVEKLKKEDDLEQLLDPDFNTAPANETYDVSTKLIMFELLLMGFSR